jgi:hypothetical protein
MTRPVESRCDDNVVDAAHMTICTRIQIYRGHLNPLTWTGVNIQHPPQSIKQEVASFCTKCCSANSLDVAEAIFGSRSIL